MAWTMASIPVMALTAAGKPTVSRASSSAISGYSNGLTTPFFSWLGVVTIATAVTSEPVPAVVGTWINGKRGPWARLIP
ncbi:hypothetical protein D3C71_1638700 [compost metagenome]